jgi:integrase
MSKRARGSGTVRKRGQALYFRYRTGGRLIEEVFPRREREKMKEYWARAYLELDRKTTGLRAGALNAPTRRTVEELAQNYLESICPTVKPRTYETVEAHVRLYILPAMGQLRVDRLTPENIRRYQQTLLSWEVRGDATMAVSTAKVVFGTFRVMVRHAMDGQAAREYWGISFDPWPQRRLTWPDARERPAPHTYLPYSSGDLRRYLTHTPDEYRCHILALVLLMLRDGELRGLRWTDLDENRKVCHIRQQQSRKHGMGTAKTASSEAALPVPDVLLDALNEHRKQQATMRLKKGKAWQDHGLIFATSKGTALPHNWFCKLVNGMSLNERIAKRAGVRRVSEHTLRKSGSTILETELVTPREVVGAALRHSGQSTTDVYVRYNAESLRPYIEKLAALVTDGLPTTCPQTGLILATSG